MCASEGEYAYKALCQMPAVPVQVLALDKRYLDPRRTVNPTQAEKEEGIIPLTDSLPIIPQVLFVSCNCLELLFIISDR